MTSQAEIIHYQEQVKTLLDAKNRRLKELQEINDRLGKMGLKSSQESTVKKTGKTTGKKTISTKKPKSEKKHPPTIVHTDTDIKATVKNMKLFLDLQGIPYGSHASRKEIEQIVRKHNLVRKVVEYNKGGVSPPP